jgi:lipopolysaccharide export LptBFGC system permease protein LptF
MYAYVLVSVLHLLPGICRATCVADVSREPIAVLEHDKVQGDKQQLLSITPIIEISYIPEANRAVALTQHPSLLCFLALSLLSLSLSLTLSLFLSIYISLSFSLLLFFFLSLALLSPISIFLCLAFFPTSRR